MCIRESPFQLMVLNTCQSVAQQEANPHASVAARLIRAGAGSVLAMNFSVPTGSPDPMAQRAEVTTCGLDLAIQAEQAEPVRFPVQP